VLPSFPYGTESTVLEPGEVFALFTDGIPEAQRGEELYDDERVRAAVAEECVTADLPTMRERLLARVDEFLAGSPRTDDITLLLLRRTGTPG
jgi:sigma-B regulation protein RsbU (phosphoserine phosphatase)